MKNFLKLALLGMTIFLCYSCQKSEAVEAPTSFKINGVAKNAEGKKLRITPRNGSAGIDIEINNDGTFTSELPLGKDAYVDFRMERQGGTFYATPGDSIHMTFDLEGVDSTLMLTGAHEAENKILTDHARWLKENAWDYKAAYSLPYADFKENLKEKYAKESAFLDQYKGKASDDFIARQRKINRWNQLFNHANYKSYHEYYSDGKKAETDEAYENIMDEIDLNDEDLIHHRSFSPIVNTLLEKQEPKEDPQGGSAVTYYTNMFNKAKGLSNSAVRTKASYNLLRDLISYGGGLDNITTEVDDFKSLATDSIYVDQIDELVAKWQPLKKGNVAPAFTATYADDSPFSNEDLNGKNMYIDVWATWCGPCKREIPALKELEKEYHGKNVAFLSVSIDDDKDLQKWKDFVRKEDLRGVQVHAADAWKSTIATSYLIRGIPRFILVDKNGKIYSANAPRPSDKEGIRKALDDILTID